MMRNLPFDISCNGGGGYVGRGGELLYKLIGYITSIHASLVIELLFPQTWSAFMPIKIGACYSSLHVME